MGGLDDKELERRWAEGRAAWPGLEVSIERFRSAAAAADGELHAADLYLALACLAGAHGALEALSNTVLTQVRPSVERAAPSRSDAEDAMQATLEKLLVGPEPKLAQYTGRGPLVGWVRVVAVRTALEAARSKRRKTVSDDAALVAAPAGTPNVDLELLRARHGAAFKSAVQDGLRKLAPEQRAILKLHARDGLSIDRIAPMLGVHRATAARRLERARAEALGHARAILREREGLTMSEARSLCIALASEVDVSIGRALGEEAP